MKIHEYNQMMNYLVRPGTPKQRAEYNVGNKVEQKNIKKAEKTNVKKPTVKMAMSESPKEEAEMMLQLEAKEVMEWLKRNKNKTYNDWLKNKEAMLTDEQKKDPKIIDLEPYLPLTFDEEIERMLQEKEKQKENETFQRGYEEGITSVLKIRKV